MRNHQTPINIKLSVLLCGLMLLYSTTISGQENQIEADFVFVAPVIDGSPNDEVWQSAKPITLRKNQSGDKVSDSILTTTVKTCYDTNKLYLLFICKDPDIWTSYNKRDDHLWKEEAVEVFIDVDEEPDNYVEIEVSPANVLFDSYIVDPQNIDVTATAQLDLPGIETAVHVNGTLNIRNDIDESWTVEIAIPFEDLTTRHTKKITNETEIKINFYRLDMNEGMDRGAYAWSPTGASFHKPSVFGRLILK
ncbi:MAG: carbohydrate-binding family 9-like protein [Aurantibacter sp.]